MTAKEPERIWTGTFVLLCITEFLSYGHHTVLTPTLPLYVTHLGGTPITVGVILAVFCASSVLLRPTIGYWADTWSYSGILSLGTCLLGFSVLLYLFPLIGMLILSNALRGIGWAGLNTAAYSILADCAPHKRRGEASGYFTSFQSCAVVLFPALALWLIEARGGSFNVVIVLSSALAFTGSGIALFLKPPSVGSTSKTRPSTARRQSASFTIVDRNVLVATIMLFCICLPLPATTSFIVLYARDIGIQGIGWYFVASGLTHVLTRPLLGRVSDRIGRGLSIASAYGLELCGLLLLSAAPNLAVLSLGGGVFCSRHRHGHFQYDGHGHFTGRSKEPRYVHGNFFRRLPTQCRTGCHSDRYSYRNSWVPLDVHCCADNVGFRIFGDGPLLVFTGSDHRL